MKNLRVAAAALIVVGFAPGIQAAPPSPVITGGTSNIKELSFAWQSVPQATRFELWFRATPGSAWGEYTEVSAGSTQVRINVSVHLLDWRVARYHVKACDASGCSTSNEVGVTGEALPALGYIKPNVVDTHRSFGQSTALSADGRTLAVVSGETIGSRTSSAAFHVYRKTTSTSGWRREARLLPNAVQSGTANEYMGSPIALSANGNVLAVGVFGEDALGPNTPEDTGAVYLFRRSGSTWRLAQKLLGALHGQDRFGMTVDLDDAGRTLVVTRAMPEGRSEQGTLEIYRDADDSSDQFVHEHTLLVPNHHASSRGFCMAASLSGDGNTLLRTCLELATQRDVVEVFNAPGWTRSARIEAGNNTGIDSTYDGRRFVVQAPSGDAAVYDLGSAGWALAPGFINSSQGRQRPHTAISRDGKIVATGFIDGSVAGLGPLYPPYTPGGTITGGVGVYELKSNGWTLRRLINPGSANVQSFGHAVALGDNGRILAVGAPNDPSAATGIDGDRDDASAPGRGAVWLY